MLEPGKYSLFVLHEGGTWEQPVYQIGEGWTEKALEAEAINWAGKTAFYACAVCPDPDCPDSATRRMQDAP